MGCLTYVVIDCHPCKVSFFLSANIGVKRTASPIVNRLPFPPSVSSSSPSPGLSLSPSSCLPMGRAQSSEVFWLMELYGWHSGRLLHCQFPGCPEKTVSTENPVPIAGQIYITNFSFSNYKSLNLGGCWMAKQPSASGVWAVRPTHGSPGGGV